MGIFYNKNKNGDSLITQSNSVFVSNSKLLELQSEIKNLKSKYSNYISPEHFDDEVSKLLKKEISSLKISYDLKLKELRDENASLKDILKRKDMVIKKLRNK